MSVRQVFGLFLIVIGVVSLVHTSDILKALSGSCRITASIDANQFELRLERGQCFENREGSHMGAHSDSHFQVGVERSPRSNFSPVQKSVLGRRPCVALSWDNGF